LNPNANGQNMDPSGLPIVHSGKNKLRLQQSEKAVRTNGDWGNHEENEENNKVNIGVSKFIRDNVNDRKVENDGNKLRNTDGYVTKVHSEAGEEDEEEGEQDEEEGEESQEESQEEEEDEEEEESEGSSQSERSSHLGNAKKDHSDNGEHDKSGSEDDSDVDIPEENPENQIHGENLNELLKENIPPGKKGVWTPPQATFLEFLIVRNLPLFGCWAPSAQPSAEEGRNDRNPNRSEGNRAKRRATVRKSKKKRRETQKSDFKSQRKKHGGSHNNMLQLSAGGDKNDKNKADKSKGTRKPKPLIVIPEMIRYAPGN
jgi:hypothetical protein